jgi:hypothetical protein
MIGRLSPINTKGKPFVSKQNLRRAAAALATTGAMFGLGVLGAGTASAHEMGPSEPTEGGVLGAAQSSAGAFMHHAEEYHLKQPTWEAESLLTTPKENFEVHHAMLDDMIDPFVGLLP